MRFSVVIPTYNRSEKLIECIFALFNQDFDKKEFEIIIVDDGSEDKTPAVLKEIAAKSPVVFSFFRQLNRGQGVARNKGIEEAKGKIILLLGDDIVATPSLLFFHDALHTRHPEENAAVLGFITWHKKLEVTPLMKFMERGGVFFKRFGGHQFAYDLLEGKKTADYRFFYTSNISLKRDVLLRFPFDPTFSAYGWEDTELGYRLTKEIGLKIYYEPAAIAYHDHPMDFDAFADRMRKIGRSCHVLHSRYPELGRVPGASKKNIFRMLGHPKSLRLCKYVNQNLYFYALSKKYFLEGLEQRYNKND